MTKNKNHGTLTGVDIANLDKADPLSLYSLVTPALRAHFDALTDEHLTKTLEEVEVELSPSITQQRLRVAVWREYDLAKANYPAILSIKTASIVRGITTSSYFNYSIRNPWFLAYLTHPPADYYVAVEESLLYGLEEIRRVLALSIMNEEGKLNTSLINSKIRIVEMLDNRVRGQAVQRIEEKSVRVNTTAKEIDINEDLGAIQKRIQELEGRRLTESIGADLLPEENGIHAESEHVENQRAYLRAEQKKLTGV